LELIAHLKDPSKPATSQTADGSVEFGLILYWIDNPSAAIEKIINDHIALSFLWYVLKKQAPTSIITTDDYNYLVGEIKDPGVVTDDGTIYGTAKYEQLDPDWIYAGLNYGINKLDSSSIHAFGTSPYQGEMLSGISGTDAVVTVALVGDWGIGTWDEDGDSGKGAAYAVMEQIKALNPDYVIHLGDVYYAGTELRLPPGEEQAKFVKVWTDIWGIGDSERFFTLNSNHEMYGGASGYFDIALAAGGPFAHQNQTSYFVLQNENWAILGMDAAYYSQSTLYMQGNLYEGKNTTQRDFFQRLDLSGKQVIALTHQTGLDYSGTTPYPLWTNDMKTALNGNDPDFWYWGHIHNGIVYTKNPRRVPWWRDVSVMVQYRSAPPGV